MKILSFEELSEDDQTTLSRARKVELFFTQPLFGTNGQAGQDGVFVDCPDTLDGFRRLLEGELDHLPAEAFFMVGNVEEAIKKGERILSRGEGTDA